MGPRSTEFTANLLLEESFRLSPSVDGGDNRSQPFIVKLHHFLKQNVDPSPGERERPIHIQWIKNQNRSFT